MSATRIRPHVRAMLRADLPEVLAIEQASFDLPWDERAFLDVLRRPNGRGVVASLAGHYGLFGPDQAAPVVGFCVYELHRSKLHVLNFAVPLRWRRLGVGHALIAHLAAKLSDRRRTKFTLEVEETNLDAQLFLRAMGLLATGINPCGHASGRDTYRFEYRYPFLSPDLACEGVT